MGIGDAVSGFVGDAAPNAAGGLAAAVLTAAGLRAGAAFRRRPDPVEIALADAVDRGLRLARRSQDQDTEPTKEWVAAQVAAWSPVFTSREVAACLLEALGHEPVGEDPAEEPFAQVAGAALDRKLTEIDLAALNREVEVDEFLFLLPRLWWEELKDAALSGRRDVRGRVEQLVGQRIEAVTGRHRTSVSPREYREDLAAVLREVDRSAREAPEYLPKDADVVGLTRAVRVRQGRRRRHHGAGGSVERAAARSGAAPENDPKRVYALPADRAEKSAVVRPWPEVAAEYPRLVVLADPGMGKSWLIRTESQRLAQAALGAIAAGTSATEVVIPVPIRCDLLVAAGSGAAGPDGVAAIAVTWLRTEYGLRSRSAPRLLKQLERGHVVLLLDAVDELPDQRARKQLEDLLAGWTSRTPKARYLITSRVAGYTGMPGHPEEFELLPFTRDDITAFLAAWRLPEPATDRIRRRLDDPAIAEMARIPLLLTLLCSLAADGEELPTRRARLYELVLRRFLAHEHRPPATDDNEVGRLLDILAPLAFGFAHPPGGGWVDLMDRDDLIDALRGLDPVLAGTGTDANSLLRQLSVQDGVLVPAGGDRPAYLFLHRTIAEWLVARHCAALPSTERLAVIDEHLWFDPDWAETISLVAAELEHRHIGCHRRQVSPVRELVRHLLDQTHDPMRHALFAAVRMVAGLTNPENALKAADFDEIAERTLTGLRDEWIRDAATDALVAAGPTLPQRLVDLLLTALTDGDVEVQKSAVEALGGCPGAKVTQALLSALTHGVPDVRWTAGRALGGRPGEDVTRALLAAFTDGDLDFRASVLAALKGRPGREVTSALLTAFTEGDPGDRVSVVLALSRRPGDEVTRTLLTALTDDDGRVQHNATLALTDRPGQEVTRALLTALTDHDADQKRDRLVRALRGRPGPAVTRVLLAALTDDAAGVRWSAAWALGGRPGEEVTGALLAALADEDAAVRDHTVQALGGREGEEVTDALLTVLTGLDANLQVSAIRALEGQPGKRVTDALLTVLTGDGGPSARWNTALALRGRPGQEVTHALLGALTDPDHYLHDHAVRALGDRYEEEVTPALLTALTRGSPTVRCSAAESLRERPGEEVTTALLAALNDSEANVRDGAAEALAHRPGGLLAVSSMTRTADPAVRETLYSAATSLLTQQYLTLDGSERTGVLAAFASLTDDNHRRPSRRRTRRRPAN